MLSTSETCVALLLENNRKRKTKIKTDQIIQLSYSELNHNNWPKELRPFFSLSRWAKEKKLRRFEVVVFPL